MNHDETSCRQHSVTMRRETRDLCGDPQAWTAELPELGVDESTGIVTNAVTTPHQNPSHSSPLQVQ